MRAAVLFLILPLAACAAHRPPPDAPGRDENYHGGPNAMLLALDADHDGTLTRAELTAGLKAAFAAADTRGKGCLNNDQVAEINQARVAADQSTATPLIDWNNDGCVDFTEYSAAAYSLFDQIDRNHDGKIEPDEFHPRAGAARGGSQPPGGQPRRGRGGPPPGQ